MKNLYRRSEYFTSESYPLVVQQDTVHDEDVDMHTHEFTECVIVSGGRGVHVTRERSWPVGRGDVFVVRAGLQHAYRSTANLSIVNILYEPERLSFPEADLQTLPGYHALFAFAVSNSASAEATNAMKLGRDELSPVLLLVDMLDAELREARPGYRCMATSLYMQIITTLSRCYERTMESESAHNVRIARAVAHLEAHLDEDLCLDDLAVLAGMSRRTFQRLFRDMVGTSPIDYLLRTRVNRAARMLAQGYAGNMGRLADAVGFRDANYFSRQFRTVMGVGPRTYARAAQPG
jgi:AraC-like DNA-binding protein